MNNTCQIAKHQNKSILTVCLASQCQGKRVCCAKCQAEFHQHHNIDQFMDFNDLHNFIKIQSQKPNSPSPQVVQVLQELNIILKDIDCLTQIIRQEIQRLGQCNLQQFCKNIESRHNLLTEKIGNQQWDDLAQEMLANVELKEGEIVEKDSLLIHLGRPYSHFMKQFSQTLAKMVNELKVVKQIVEQSDEKLNQNQMNSLIELNQKTEKEKQEIDFTMFQNLVEHHKLQSHTNSINSIDICESRNLLVSGSGDFTVKLWDLKDNTLIQTFRDTNVVHEVVFSNEGEFIAFGGISKIIKLVDIGDLTREDKVSELKGHFDSVTKLAFWNNEMYLISGSKDQTIRIWGIQKGNCAVYGLAINKDNTLIASPSWSNGIKLLDFINKKQICTQVSHTDGAGIQFSDDQQSLISSGEDGMIRLWSLKQLNQGKVWLIKEFKAANNCIQRVLLTPDSKFIICYSSRDKQVKVIDSNTCERIKLFEIKNVGNLVHVGLAITKSMIAYSDGNDVVLWKKRE